MTPLVELVLERGFTALTRGGHHRAGGRRPRDLLQPLPRQGRALRPGDRRTSWPNSTSGCDLRCRTARSGFTGKPVLEMLRHAHDERDLYRIVLRGRGGRQAAADVHGSSRLRAARGVPWPRRTQRGRTENRLRAPRPGVGRRAGRRPAVVGGAGGARPCRPRRSYACCSTSRLHGRYWASGLRLARLRNRGKRIVHFADRDHRRMQPPAAPDSQEYAIQGGRAIEFRFKVWRATCHPSGARLL